MEERQSTANRLAVAQGDGQELKARNWSETEWEFLAAVEALDWLNFNTKMESVRDDAAEIATIIARRSPDEGGEAERIWRLAYSTACAGNAGDYCLRLLQQMAEDDGVTIERVQPDEGSDPSLSTDRVLSLEGAAALDNYCPRCRMISLTPSHVLAVCACGDEAWADCCADQECSSCGLLFQVPAR